VIVTGRPAAEILPLLGVEPSPEVWGLHGAERMHADGRRELEQIPPAICAQFGSLSAQLRRDVPGGLIEEKPNAVVMHWRGISAGKARLIEKQTRSLFEPLAGKDGLSLLEFSEGLELRFGRDKGDVVRLLLDEAANGHPHPAAYLGDDLTDEVAFCAIKGRGIGALVRRKRRASAADVWLRPPEGLRGFLIRWLWACTHLQSNVNDPLLNSR